MASLGRRTPSDANGGAAAATIPVENPATGEIISTVPVLGEPELERMVERARAARHGWEAMGFEGRGRVLRRAQRWMLDNPERILEVVVSETGKTYEDAQLADLGYTVTALGFGPRRPRATSPTSAYRRGTTRSPPARSSSSGTPRSASSA